MANRLIGMEVTPRTMRVVILGQGRGGFELIAAEQLPYAAAGAIPELLAGSVPGGFQLSDRAAAALPAGEAYVRTLRFPFRERRKILAAAPFELAAQLPVAPEEYQTALLAPREEAEGARVVAAAVPIAAIEQLLAPFEQSRTPLHLLDLMPYALTGGLGDTIDTGILICINESEATLSGLRAGEVVDYRHLPLADAELTPEITGQLLRETIACRSRLQLEQAPVFLTGALATRTLCERMIAQGLPAELLAMTLGSREIAPAFVPAAALAMRAARKVDDRCFNLRQGRYAYRGEAAALKKTLYGFGGLLVVSLLLFTLAAGLAYRDRSRRADALLQQMTKQYQETFPGSQLTVDVPLQMQSKLQELRNRATALGIGGQPQALPILKELAAVTARTPYEAEDFSCDETACLLSGSTGSFDDVNRIKEQLGATALFEKIEVVDTRKGVDAQRIEFRLRLPLTAEGGAQ